MELNWVQLDTIRELLTSAIKTKNSEYARLGKPSASESDRVTAKRDRIGSQAVYLQKILTEVEGEIQIQRTELHKLINA
jgi:hypothetical protein